MDENTIFSNRKNEQCIERSEIFLIFSVIWFSIFFHGGDSYHTIPTITVRGEGNTATRLAPNVLFTNTDFQSQPKINDSETNCFHFSWILLESAVTSRDGVVEPNSFLLQRSRCGICWKVAKLPPAAWIVTPIFGQIKFFSLSEI